MLNFLLFVKYRIGLCGFENPMRDSKTEEAKKHINQGVKIKMDEQGNILIKRLCKNNVYIKPTSQEDNAIGAEIARNSQGALEHEKPGKVSVLQYISRTLFSLTFHSCGHYMINMFLFCFIISFFFFEMCY